MSDETIPGFNNLSISDFQARLDRLLDTVKQKWTNSAKARNEKPSISLEAIANAGGIALRTLHNWRNRNLKALPRQRTIKDFCESLHENPERFFAPFDLLTEEKKIRMMNESRADTLGIKDSFMEYLKHEPDLEADFANSIPEEDHIGYTGYQLTDFYGESRYPDEITAYVIRLIQTETEQYILSRLHEYRRMSHSFTGEEARAAYLDYLKQRIEENDKETPAMTLA